MVDPRAGTGTFEVRVRTPGAEGRASLLKDWFVSAVAALPVFPPLENAQAEMQTSNTKTSGVKKYPTPRAGGEALLQSSTPNPRSRNVRHKQILMFEGWISPDKGKYSNSFDPGFFIGLVLATWIGHDVKTRGGKKHIMPGRKAEPFCSRPIQNLCG